jgi:hypothetical protein
MTIRANILANTSNATVIVDSVSGIAREDVFVSNITLRDKNVRVIQTFAGNGVVVLNKNVAITTGNVVQFQKLVNGVGLIASESRVAYFLRDRESYTPSLDPRLPKTTTLVSNLIVGATSVTIAGTTMSLGLSPIIVPYNAAQDRYGANIQFQSVSDIQVGDYALGTAYNFETNVRVVWVGNGNTYVGFNKPITTSAGQTFLFRRPVQPAIKIGSEVIYYSNISVGNSAVTLSDIVRNVANTRPINQVATTLAENSSGAVLEVTDPTGIQEQDYVLINNTTLSSNVRVIWVPVGEGNANVGISAGISASSGTAVKFQRDWIWTANTTVSILGSIPL